MRVFPSLFLHFLNSRASRRNLKTLRQLIYALTGMVAAYSIAFHFLMAWEGRTFSWITGVYWTLTVMSTLGFGDITFHSDIGRLFSIVVLLSGTVFMLILLPFTLVQFFYAPWMEAQAAARAPRRVPKEVTGHVVLTRYGPVDAALVRKLTQYHYPYVVLAPDVAEALRLHDQDLQVMVGEVDDPDTYRKVGVERAALVVTTHSDTVNTNVAFTVREIAETPVVATALEAPSVDILELAGCNRVLQLAEMLGHSLAWRIIGRDAKTHVIGQFDDLLIAEASAANTPLVGRTLQEIRLPDHVKVNVVGIWERGRFETARASTCISQHDVLVLAGTRTQLDEYDALFCIYHASDDPVVILGGGRVGRACARALKEQNIAYRIVEKHPDRVHDDGHYIRGDAADLEILKQAGIDKAPAVAITTHDDDMNVYLTLYCRRLRPDVQIISRATLERNINTLHRAGADFVMSYASMGANAIFNLLQRGDVLLLAEGVDVFQVDVPPALAGKTLASSAIRQETGCSVIAIDHGDGMQVNPDPTAVLPAQAELLLIGDAEAESRFHQRYARR